MLDNLGDCVFELFRNTHDWARTDYSGRLLRKSARYVHVELHWTHQIANEGSTVGAFIGRSLSESLEGGAVVEISVVDSGPGLAARWLGRPIKDLSPDKELAACVDCLRKHRTSAYASHAGVGLAEVMRNLSALSGMLRIRTGRFSLGRDFTSRRYQPGDENDPLVDWESAGSPRPVPEIQGTTVTMLVPVAGQAR